MYIAKLYLNGDYFETVYLAVLPECIEMPVKSWLTVEEALENKNKVQHAAAQFRPVYPGDPKNPAIYVCNNPRFTIKKDIFPPRIAFTQRYFGKGLGILS